MKSSTSCDDVREADSSQSPGKLIWLISCDESGTHGAPYYGFGTLWMKWQRRGDFHRDFEEIKSRFGFLGDEVKWSKAQTARNLEFHKALLTYFFAREWMQFHCLVVRRAIVKKDLHGSWDLARRKHFTKLLTNKMSRVCRKHSNRDVHFRIYVDPIASSYDKADEVVEIVSNNVLRAELGSLPVDSVVTRDSKETPTIQLCDLLLGAVMEAWQGKSVSLTKNAIQQHIADALGWTNLKADTRPHEPKFNIWYFYDEEQGPREVTARKVILARQ